MAPLATPKAIPDRHLRWQAESQGGAFLGSVCQREGVALRLAPSSQDYKGNANIVALLLQPFSLATAGHS